MVGIKRLAQHVNMSISTVSRALNNRPDSSEETRRRVREAAVELGYFANQSGRSLRSGATGIIGFMMQTRYQAGGHFDNFFMGVFDGVQSVLARHHLDLVALLCPSGEDESEFLRRLVSRGFVDGVIISHTLRADSRIEFLAKRKLPFVTLGRSLTDVGQPWIDIDFEAIARLSVRRFLSRGHRRIAIWLPNDEINYGYVALESAQAELAAHGLALEQALVFRSEPSEASGYELAYRLLASPEPPTAIVLINELLTNGLYRGLTEQGCMPGRDLAIIGRDSAYTPYLSPPLTSFSQSLPELGVVLGESLLAMMPRYAAEYPTGVVRRIFPTTMVEGESDALIVPGKL